LDYGFENKTFNKNKINKREYKIVREEEHHYLVCGSRDARIEDGDIVGSVNIMLKEMNRCHVSHKKRIWWRLKSVSPNVNEGVGENPEQATFHARLS